jgi:hypothetical protein
MRHYFYIAVVLFSFSISAFADCVVQAPQCKNLESMSEVLCEDAAYALSQAKGYLKTSPLRLQVIYQDMYFVSISYAFEIEPGKTISGIGTEFWYPGDTYFQVYE